MTALVSLPGEVSAYTPHGPILIDGNANFTAANGVTGGSGTPSDPYIIDGWEIDASTAHGVEIRSTDAHFVLRDIYVHSGGSNYYGVYLVSLTNGAVENSTLSQDWVGTVLWSSTNVTVTANDVSTNAWYGISLYFSTDIMITANNLSSNLWGGIVLSFSTNVAITSNNVSNNGVGIYLYSSTNVTVTANDVSTNAWDGISLSSSTDAMITANNLSSNYGYGISVGSSSDATITANNISNNRDGILLDHSTNVTISANTFLSNGVYIWGTALSDFSSHTITVDNSVNGKPLHYYKDCTGLTVDGILVGQLLVANCTDFTAANLQIADTDVGIEMAFSARVTITANNVSSNNGWGGIYLWSISNSTIASNNVSSNDRNGIYLYSSTDVMITANNISSNNGDGILLDSSTNVAITANNVSNNWWGIDLDSSTNIAVTANNVSNNGDGISLYGSTNVTITANNVSNIMYGIRLLSSTDVTITANNVSNNSWGIDLGSSTNIAVTANNVSNNGNCIYLDSSTNVIITANNVSNNGNGIRLYWSIDVMISANNVSSNNGWGIHLDSSTNVAIHHNNLISNAVQASDDRGPVNFWDEGYPSGGNYWSDYGGVDQFSGPSQDQAGLDGIGDTPYVIDANSQDDYPLMGPSGGPDTVPPTVSILTPSNGVVLAATPVTGTGSAADAGGSGLDRVEVRVNGGSWQAATGTTSWNLSVDLAPGASLIEAQAWDNAGNPSTIESVNVVYDPDAPTVSITSPADGLWTSSTSQVVTGTAADAGSGLDRIEVSCDGGSTWNTATGTTSWNSTCSGLVPGANDIHARSLDIVGWESVHAIVAVNHDPDAPAATISSPANGSWINTPTAGITGTASDTGGSGLDRVEVRLNGGPWQTATGTSSWNLSVTLVLGDNLIEARAYDNASNPSVLDSINGTYAIPPGPPRNLTAVAVNGKITLSWETPASDGGSPISHYKVYRGTTGSGVLLAEVENVLTYEDADAADGVTYDYTVTAVNAGGEGPQSNEASATPPAPPASLFAQPGLWAVIAMVIGILAVLAILLVRRREKKKGTPTAANGTPLERSHGRP
ncbi:MAG TPA: right-handed parallel beta-helix repeat-containing protein [Thermoplasmata archaeon]|nr:right-handed parallel beta-helix repeat-containing protein [Thermoplasmata archaeon]